MPREALGQFEELVLLAILHLGDGTYGVPIIEEIAARTDREVAPAAVYIALQRLEKKGLVSTRLEAPGEGPPGKPRRLVSLQPEAIEMLRASHRTMTSMWAGLEPILEDR
ncbi:MAG: helix-turn-helix transcriptional regulator [Acidobacteriota bacterium]|jgi:DNA-binding PadR family transcriptional regulator